MKEEKKILLAHGGGGILTHQLIKERIIPKLGNPQLNPLLDSAVLDNPGGRICMTTDGYVVQPIEFPGGDIGRLSICGTVNDLAVMGARPLGISLAMVIEEGLSLEILDRIVDSIADSAKEAQVNVVTGDTKVVEHGRGDGITITTAGVGILRDNFMPGLDLISENDVLIVNGNVAEHGLAVMSAREGLSFTTSLESDVAPLNGLIGDVLGSGADVKFIRDLTRGGLAGVLVDICEDAKLSVEVGEDKIPVSRVAHHTAELLGLDPLTVANEGKCLFVVAKADADKALAACRNHKYGSEARIIGSVRKADPPLVELVTRMGGRRIIQRRYGEELPRFC